MTLTQLSEEQIAEILNLSRLLYLEPILSILRYIFVTNFILNKEHAVSLGLSALPSRGKSEVLGVFRNSSLKFKLVNNVTAYAIEKDLMPKIRRGEVSTLAISDLTATLERAETTKKSFISILLGLTEEGITYQKSYVSDVEVKKPIRLQFLYGITPDMLARYMPSFVRSGFSTRMLYVSWDYTDEQVNAILNNKIQQNAHGSGVDKVVVPKGSRSYFVTIPEHFNDRIKIIGKSVVEETNYSYVVKKMVSGPNGTLIEKEKTVEVRVLDPVRTVRDLATVLRAICLCRHLDNDLPREEITVNEEDFAELMRISYWLNLKRRTLTENV